MRRRSRGSRRHRGAWTGAVVAGAASTGAVAAASTGDCGREVRRRRIRPPLCATAGWIRRDCGCSGDGRLWAEGAEAQQRQAGGEASTDPAAAPHPTRMVLAMAARIQRGCGRCGRGSGYGGVLVTWFIHCPPNDDRRAADGVYLDDEDGGDVSLMTRSTEMGLAPSPVSIAAIWVVGSGVVGTMVEEIAAHHPQQSHPSLSHRG
uniref:Uncharacterized protein n=1 Tax=Oryza meridionalis TaxID=40149 RepID=A0A0E0EPY2_9ORYZ